MDRLSNAYRETPWTVTIIGVNLLVWLLWFFGLPQPMALLGGELDVAHAWRWLTYPLASPSVALWLLLGLYCFYLFTSSLERRWGSLRFVRIFVSVTLLLAGCHWLGTALVLKSHQAQVALSGLSGPALAMLVIWASLYRELEIRLFFVIPVKAKYVGIGAIVLSALDPLGLLYSLPTAALLTGLWFWAGAQRGHAAATTQGSFQRWWSQKRRDQRKSRFQVLQGGAAVGGTSVSQPPSPEFSRPSVKLPDASETELDRILDKIRYEGMEALTKDERAHLDRQSQKLRGEP